MNICVFCSSSNALAPHYFEEARKLGDLMIQHKHDLVYGGSNVGLMNELANTIRSQGGKVTGVIPELIRNKGLGHANIDDLIVTPDMAERKKKMANLSDAFIALPGGFGTLEEILEIITLKQLQVHNKGVVFLNTNGFYDKLMEFFEVFYKNHFAKTDYRDYYFVANTCEEAIAYIENYQAPDFKDKWYWVGKEEFEK
ncbi:MAG: TIGR00730 family Rossman fold protein [Bacteroidales bacterium]|nr:TIGR00730 family Rossman fold protein [Bacteroidales bacterium]MCF8454382.1 TIGR00730 family Rossman fold protein [Bacteroidales bacterium]